MRWGGWALCQGATPLTAATRCAAGRTYLDPNSLVHGEDLSRGSPLSSRRRRRRRGADCVVQRHGRRLVMCLGRHGGERTQDDVGDEAATEREVRLDYVDAKRRDEQSRKPLLANKEWRVACVEQMRQFGGWRLVTRALEWASREGEKREERKVEAAAPWMGGRIKNQREMRGNGRQTHLTHELTRTP